jgi:hypothetical protein
MAEFIAQCKELGEDQIAERDAVWTYAESAGIPDECIKLAWAEFKARHIDTQTRYSNWRRAFQNCVRGNWYRLWAIDESAQCVLTSAGRQARKVHGGPKAA